MVRELRARVLGRYQVSPVLVGTMAVLGLLSRLSLARTIVLILVTLVVATLPVAVMVVTGQLVGAIPAMVGDGPNSPAAREAVFLLAVAGALIFLIRTVGPLQRTLAYTFAREVELHLQERVMAAIAGPSGIGHLETPATLDLIHNAQGVGGDGPQPGDAVRALATLLPSWLRALGSALVLVSLQWWLGLFLLIMWPIILYILQREFVRVGQVASGMANAVRRASYLRDLALTPAAAKEIRIWSMLDWLTTQFDAAWRAGLEPVWRARRPSRPVLGLVSGAVAAANVAAFIVLAQAVLSGNLGLGAVAIYARAILEASAFRAFDDPNAQLAYAAASVPSLLELERRLAAPAAGSSDQPVASALLPDPLRDGIRFEGVTFGYPGQAVDVLDGLDLFIPAGRSLAIVGLNGAGKTTLIKLLCGLYYPRAGRITADGIDLRFVAPRAWQRQVAAIFQDFVHYPLSARDNLALGAGDRTVDLDRLQAAAEKAGARELIEALPRGWETILSREFAGGAELSGGQWQRIALARAFVAVEAGARVLILDEPTANLDVRAEAALYDRFLDLSVRLTTILVAHRFSTVRRAQWICVLDRGRVVEQGTHDDLIALGRQYTAMFALQASHFADTASPVAEPAER
jgi:ABC-type multidrug transport system fused ATPase/permease subunit